MKDILFRVRYILVAQVIFVVTSFFLWGWFWGLVNICAATIGIAIGVGLARMHEQEGP